MAKVFLTEVESTHQRVPWQDSYLILKDCALSDRFRSHCLCDSPELADIILCVDAGAKTSFDVLRHPLYAPYVDRFFSYNTFDYVFPFVPGVYPSIARSDYDPRRTKSGVYVQTARTDCDSYSPIREDSKYLFSFVGATLTHKVRAELASLNHSKYRFIDTSKDPARLSGQAADVYQRYKQNYDEILRESKFVLCPRGAGPSSFRLFETMRAGRVPVIISDEWVEPDGPDWNAFSVRVLERQVSEIPRLIQDLEDRAETMGRAARASWEQWFAKDVVFHRIVESCIAMRSTRQLSERLERWLVRRRLLTRRHFRGSIHRALKHSRAGRTRSTGIPTYQ